MHQRPGTLLEGELHRCCMVMRNVGASPLHNVRMVVSHPDVFCPMSNQELQAEPTSALSGKLSFDGIDACVEPYRVCDQTLTYQMQSSAGQIRINSIVHSHTWLTSPSEAVLYSQSHANNPCDLCPPDCNYLLTSIMWSLV